MNNNIRTLIYLFGEEISESVKGYAKRALEIVKEEWAPTKAVPTINFDGNKMVVSGTYSDLDWFEIYFRKSCQEHDVRYTADLRALEII